MIRLFTQCPECSTVFRVSAKTLRAAQGRVRCGICSTTFSALQNLSEHPVPGAMDEPRAEDAITVEELPATESIELAGNGGSAARGEDLEVPAAPAPEPEVARAPDDHPQPDRPHEEEGLDGVPDAALEFHGSAEDLERLFVEAAGPAALVGGGQRPGPDIERAIDELAGGDFSGIEVRETELPWPGGEDWSGMVDPQKIAALLALPTPLTAGQAGASGRGGADSGTPVAETPKDDDLDRTDEYPVLVIADAPDAGEPGSLPDGMQPAVASTDGSAEAPQGETSGDEAASEGAETPVPSAGDRGEVPLLLIPEQLRRDAALGANEELAAPAEFEVPAGPRRWPTVVAALVLALALGAQTVHHWREDLARHPALGPWLLGTYAALGVDTPAPVDLAAFELRQLGAASEPSRAGRIKVRASIVNRAPFAQPYPILRLTLQDRFGSTIGARDLEPGQYLPGGAASASGLLGASQRADAEVVFVDPGRDAVGFELDVCVAGTAGLRCSADLPQVRE